MKRIVTLLLSLGLLFAIVYSPDMIAKELKMNLEVHLIDIGQGDSILIKSDGENMLIDAGTRSSSETVVNYLIEQGVKDLKYVVGTHPHEDHIGGLIAVLDNFNVENIMLPNVLNSTRIFEDLLDTIEKEGLKIEKPVPLNTIALGNAELTVLAPNSYKYKLVNDYSIVLKLEHGDNSFLFTGDAEKTSEKEMLEAHKSILKADVLKAGHHGSYTSSSNEFLDAVNPEYAIMSLASENTYGHPHKSTLENFDKRGLKVYRTDVDGSIVIKSDGENIEFIKKIVAKGYKELYVAIEKNLKNIKDSFIIKYITAKVNPENM